MASTQDFKNGFCMEFNNELVTIVQFQHVKPGKGSAFVRTKLKNIKTGRVVEHTFSSGERVQEARIERRPHQYLFKEESGFVFMHNETYEQISLPEDMVENADLMKEGQYVEVVIHADSETPLSCDLPPFVELVVTYTEPGFKGDTASSNAQKPADLETGAKIYVPMFINIGDKLKIDTRDRSYYERVK